MKLDPTLLSALSWSLENALNEALKHDPGTRAQLKQLNSELISVAISDWNIVLNLRVQGEALYVSLQSVTEFDKSESSTILTGSIKDFISLAQNEAHTLANSNIDVQGKVSTLEALQTLLKNLDIDWQDALGQKLGPLATPLIAAIRSATDVVRNNVARNKEIAKEFLEHESGLNVHSEEFAVFQENAALLRSATDRLEAKIRQISRHPVFEAKQ